MGDAKGHLLFALREVEVDFPSARRLLTFVRENGRAAQELEPSVAGWPEEQFAICEVPVSLEGQYLPREALAVFREYHARGVAESTFPVRCLYLAMLTTPFWRGLAAFWALYAFSREHALRSEGSRILLEFAKIQADLDADEVVAKILDTKTRGALQKFAQDQQPFREFLDAVEPAALFVHQSWRDQTTMREQEARVHLVTRCLRRLRMPLDVLRREYAKKEGRPSFVPAIEVAAR